MSYTVYDKILDSHKVEYNKSLMEIDSIGVVMESKSITKTKPVDKTIRSIDHIIDKLGRWQHTMLRQLQYLHDAIFYSNNIKVAAFTDQVKANSNQIRAIISNGTIDIDTAISMVEALYRENSALSREAIDHKNSILVNNESYRIIRSGIRECDVALKNLSNVGLKVSAAMNDLPSNYNSVFTTLHEYTHDGWRYSTKSTMYTIKSNYEQIDKNNLQCTGDECRNQIIDIDTIAGLIDDTIFYVRKNEIITNIYNALRGIKANIRDSSIETVNDSSNFTNTVKGAVPEYLLNAYTAAYELAEMYKAIVTYRAKFIYLLIASQK